MRPVKRKTRSVVREAGKIREIVVTVDPETGLVGFRPSGCRTTEWLPASYLWTLGVKRRVEAEAREKRKRGKAK